MKFFKIYFLPVLFVLVSSHGLAQTATQYEVKDHYTKKEVVIPMRDGTKLHTTIFSPKDTSKEYPILMTRTPYSSRPYGKGQFRSQLGPNEYLMKQGNIFVYQDVRGRWMSEGVYDNMRAFIPKKKGKQFDEASDTYDTVEWLVKNVKNNNGRVGLWGISYPGFYTTYSLLANHPAIKAVSPQASIGDFFFDDFHHNGAYMLSYWRATAVFGYEKSTPSDTAWYSFPELNTKDQYQFFLDAGPLKNLDKYYGEDNVFWQQLKEHPNYDEFWQKRGIVQHLKDIKPAVMVVGGLFDAEDLYGPFNIYETIEKNGDTYNMLVMGPWSHGDWARKKDRQAIGNVYFGDNISENYQKEVETLFFNHFLKGEADEHLALPEAYMFDTGLMEWKTYEAWPPKMAKKKAFYLGDDQQLIAGPVAVPAVASGAETFISDPNKPVPYSEDIKMVFTPRKYMTDDQRFAARRPDVLVYETEVLEEDFTLAGEVLAKLQVATTGTAADWIVKVVDVFPPDAEDFEETQDYLSMSNYHMMVRSEVIRGRFRNSFSNPEPFEPNKKTQVNLQLQDVHHTFKKGHKLQIQVQSSWFPLIDLNPQTYVDNIFEAEEEDFQKQEHKVFHDSQIIFSVLE
ncbi:CocE/NonD family hydrolase [Salinimicrobium sp. MT39]|uniref:CocE/NonD family hydrolase n=1 Tax=Salinimicrobium profundisediminis TaxID=2994553 RepID=A0A9X3CYK2_9FLAO|nr:CocE/NonD family hydrolase [Salinimicrobium profundisediminis]MCX2837735.1 CocE/NonD family hydrolase [Salinimicrobium profundisediminis]